MNDFFDLIATFFAELTNEEKILLGILGILVFLIGFILGWIMQASKTRRYKKELLLLRKDRDEYEVRYRSGEEKQKALAKEIEALSREKVDVLDRIHALEAERVQFTGLQNENENLRASVSELNGQLGGLEVETERLQLALEEAKAQPAVPTGRGADAGTMNGTEQPTPTSTNDSLNAYISLNEQRLRSLEERMITLAQENAVLKAQQGGGMASRGGTPQGGGGYTVQDPVPAPAPAPTSEPLVIRADTTEPGVRTGNQGGTEVIVETTPSIQVPPLQSGTTDDRFDDLTQIKDIGPFLQAELNKADIYRYEQIANWSEADIVTYTELIGYLPGIIQRDDWVGQAQGLLEEQPAPTEAEIAPADGATTQVSATAEDNLRVIEGIGPKIETVLKEAGIKTLEALATTSGGELRELLNAAGSRFKSHDPKTWPVQAGLAADGKMDELKAWQQELKASR